MISNKERKQFDWFTIAAIRSYFNKEKITINKYTYKKALLGKISPPCFIINLKILECELLEELYAKQI